MPSDEDVGRVEPAAIALMIETDGPGGAEVVFCHLAEALRARGHRVHPIGPLRGKGWLSGRLLERGFDRRTFELRRPLDPQCLRELVATLRELDVQAIHGHEFTMGFYGALAARWLGIPNVITMHGDQGVTAAARRRWALRWAASMSEAFVAVSDDLRRSMTSRLGMPIDAMQVVPNGIPFEEGRRSALRDELGLDDDCLLVVAAGSLRPNKAHEILIRALARIAEREPGIPWRLAIAGQGPEQPRLEALARELGCADRVRLLGLRDDIPDLLAGADVFAMPSYSEGLPMALLEAMFAGLGIAISRVGGMPEAIDEGVHGLAAPPGDVDAWAEVLRTLLIDEEARLAMGARARERAQARYAAESMAAAYERLYLGAGNR